MWFFAKNAALGYGLGWGGMGWGKVGWVGDGMGWVGDGMGWDGMGYGGMGLWGNVWGKI